MKKAFFATALLFTFCVLAFAGCSKNDKASYTTSVNGENMTTDVAEKVSEKLDDAADKVSEKASEIGETLRDAGQNANEKVSDAAETLSEKISDAMDNN